MSPLDRSCGLCRVLANGEEVASVDTGEEKLPGVYVSVICREAACWKVAASKPGWQARTIEWKWNFIDLIEWGEVR